MAGASRSIVINAPVEKVFDIVTNYERYAEFLEIYPSVASRVPQWMVASYLGVTPETVSRIRRKFAGRATSTSRGVKHRFCRPTRQHQHPPQNR